MRTPAVAEREIAYRCVCSAQGRQRFHGQTTPPAVGRPTSLQTPPAVLLRASPLVSVDTCRRLGFRKKAMFDT
jgi:hypothetical protein